MKKDKIYIKHWLEFKPYNNESQVDLEYLKICNKIYSKIFKSTSEIVIGYIGKENFKKFICFLVCYFEDKISEIGLWETFQVQYKKQYDKHLPLFEIDESDYFEDDINYGDVAFLTWYYLNKIQQDHIISPYNDFIYDIAAATTHVFEKEYEYVPENPRLQEYYTFVKTADFYAIRDFIQKVFFDGYLFFPDIRRRFDEDVEEMLEENEEIADHMKMAYIREMDQKFTFNRKSVLLTMTAAEWTSHFLKHKKIKHKTDFESFSKHISGFFLYKGQDENYIYLEHIASGKPFDLYKESFDHYEELENDTIVWIGMVQWKHNWWFAGNYTTQKFNADLILNLKNSLEARAQVNFLNDPQKVKEVLEKQDKAFLDFNNGLRTVNIDHNELHDFTKKYFNFYTDSLQLSEEEKEASRKRVKEDGLIATGLDDDELLYDEDEFIVTVFFNPNKGMEIVEFVDHLFPETSDEFEELDRDDVIHLIFHPYHSPEFVSYYLERYNAQIVPLKEDYLVRNYMKNLDFLLQFSKCKSYEDEPQVTLFDF
ncbi:MAG: DUF3843 family protein [Bacteroidota bacterium]